MNILLRIATLVLGLGLVIAPPLLMFGMAASMGELEEVDSLARLLAAPLLVGLLLGAGPAFVGLPALVSGPRRPFVRLVAGVLMVASILAMALTLIVTLQGRIAPVIGSALAIEVAAFSVFVWPAWSFSANSPLNPDAPASSTPIN